MTERDWFEMALFVIAFLIGVFFTAIGAFCTATFTVYVKEKEVADEEKC